MRTFKEIIKELKEKIIKEDYYHECKEYCKGCSQCEFWIKFNAIGIDLLLLEKECVEQNNEVKNGK